MLNIFLIFSQSTFRLIQTTTNSIDVSGLKLLTRLRVDFSHLKKHKLKYNFQDTLNPLCPCYLEAEDTYHFFIRCQNRQMSKCPFH